MLLTANEDPKMNTFYIPVSWAHRSSASPGCLPTLFVHSNGTVCSQLGHFQLRSLVCLSAAVTPLGFFFFTLWACVCMCVHVGVRTCCFLPACLCQQRAVLIVCYTWYVIELITLRTTNKFGQTRSVCAEFHVFIFKSIPHVVERVEADKLLFWFLFNVFNLVRPVMSPCLPRCNKKKNSFASFQKITYLAVCLQPPDEVET